MLNSNRSNLKSHLCLGLDIFPELLPSYITFKKNFVEYFLEGVIEATQEIASAYKFNLAFFESMGSYGLKVLENILPKIPITIQKIGDAKRGDINSSSKMYAKAFYEHFRFDAVTLNPLLGYDSLEPFFRYLNKTNYILALTSNPGAKDFQKQKLTGGKAFFEDVLTKVKQWNKKHKNLGIVFGATNLKEFKYIDSSFSDIPILIPGIGQQGGNLESVLKQLKKNKIEKFLITSSRSILYTNLDGDFRKSIYQNANKLHQQILEIYYK